MVMTFFVGLGLFGAMTFLPLYQQTVQGATPTVSGLLLTPLMVGSALTSVIAGPGRDARPAGTRCSRSSAG